jgi:predicted nucleic acid-binding protein
MSGSSPDKNVKNWLDGIDDTDIFFSVTVVMEQRKGLELARRKKNANLAAITASEERLRAFVRDFGSQILHVDADIAEEWGRLVGERQQDLMDLLLAATANCKRFVVVTRNVSHFKGRVETVIDPFKR